MGDSEQVEWKFMKLYLTDIVKTISDISGTRRSKGKPVAYHEEQQPEVANSQSSESQLRTPQRNFLRQSPRTHSNVLKGEVRGISPVSGSGEESDKEASPPKRRTRISSSKKTRTKSHSKDYDECSGSEPDEQPEESTKRKSKHSNSKKKRSNISCKEEDNDNLSDEQTVVASSRKGRRKRSDFNRLKNIILRLRWRKLWRRRLKWPLLLRGGNSAPPKKITKPCAEDKAKSDHYELVEQTEETPPRKKRSKSKKVRARTTTSENVVEVESDHFKMEKHAAAKETTLRKRQRRSKISKKKRSKSPPKEASESSKHVSKTRPKDLHEEERDQDAKTQSKDLSEESDQDFQTEPKDLSEEEWHRSDHSEEETEQEVLPAKRKRGPKSKKTVKSDSENVTVKKQCATGLKAPRIRFRPPIEKRIRVKTLNICSFCEKVLPNRAALSRHLQRHTGEKPYHCEECGKDYGSKTTLKIHNMQVHHKGTKDFICN
ncbi:unnamed protein product, partial [Coregonus sp. 'balchen']